MVLTREVEVWWDGLPEDVQSAFVDAGDASGDGPFFVAPELAYLVPTKWLVLEPVAGEWGSATFPASEYRQRLNVAVASFVRAKRNERSG